MMKLKYPHKIIDVNTSIQTYKLAVASNFEELFNSFLKKDANSEDATDERIPYWADLWASAIGLGEYIHQNNNLFENKSVLEIGCGLGLSGVIASSFSKHVTFTDYLPEPLEFAAHNCYLNDATNVSFSALDWRKPDKSFAAEILIAADVAYERRMFSHLVRAFKHLVKKNGIILISEPDRHYARTFFSSLKEKGFERKTTVVPVSLNGIDYNINVHQLQNSL
jgi:predicted nicotinamide N-methyase